MTGAELARRLGVSPAYISLIESGAKVPRVRKAVELAAALDDDPAPYRLWALMARGGEEEYEKKDWEGLARSLSFGSDPRMRRHLGSGEDMPQLASPAVAADATELAALRSELASVRADAERFVEVPVVEAGVDPGPGSRIPEELVLDRLLLDRALVRGDRLLRPFAFRAGGSTTARLRGEARPGDWVVISSAVGKLAPDTVYAVRTSRGLVLSHVVSKGSTLLLPSGEGRRDIEVIEVGKAGPFEHLAGRVALVVRRGD